MTSGVSNLSGSPTPAERPALREVHWFPRCVTALRWLLVLIAAWYFAWPVYRAFLNIEIDTNEGWNAYFADAALGRMPLYPSQEKLITNNYPPVSYYIVGGFGRLVGDPILAGRLLSLLSVLVIGGAVAAAIRALGGDRPGAGVGAAVFVATISRFCGRYVGMDDPQLLAQATMIIGFVGFLRAHQKNQSCILPILLMAFAGFMKHNIIAMPVTAFLWMALNRPLEAIKCGAASVVAVVFGFGLCFVFYGHDFFANMLFSRQYSWARSFHSAGDLKPLNVALLATVLVGWFRWRDRKVRFCLLLTAIALGTFFLQRTGAGVDENAIFDLMIAVSMGAGLAFSHAAPTPIAPCPGDMARQSLPKLRFLTGRLQAALLLALVLRFIPSQHYGANRSFRMFFDPTFKDEIAVREKAMAASIATVRETPGLVMSSNFVCYRAGKPFAIDKFNAAQRIATGALPPDALTSRLAARQLDQVHSDRRADWDNPIDTKP